MERWRTHTRLPWAVDALGAREAESTTRRLVEAFGGHAVAMPERLVGEPAYRSRRLQFKAGAEIILHDDAVAAVVVPELDLSEWIARSDATLTDVAEAIGARPRFAGLRTPYFTLDGGYARCRFADNWNEPGNLLSITVIAEQPGLANRPEDDDCPTCSNLLVRTIDPDGGVDVDGTVESLAEAVSAGALTEDASWVRLADLRALQTSQLMERVEAQLECTTCRRIVCFTLFRDSPPTFGYWALNDSRRRPLEAIPPVAQWGDATRIATEASAMHYVDHEPAAWFLVEQQGSLYLDARYSYSAVIDDSALIRLDDSELEAYRAGGRDYLSELATRIHYSAPYREESPFYSRDLYRDSDGKSYRDAVAAAIVNHTWSRTRHTGA